MHDADQRTRLVAAGRQEGDVALLLGSCDFGKGDLVVYTSVDEIYAREIFAAAVSAVKGVCRSISNPTTSRRRSAASAGIASTQAARLR